MFLLVNPDGSVNYAGEHPIEDHQLCFDNTELLEFPEHELMDKIHPDLLENFEPSNCAWCPETEMIIFSPYVLKCKEQYWASRKLLTFQKKLQHKQALEALGIPVPTQFAVDASEGEDYIALLDYISKEDYKDAVRPELKSL